MVACGLLQARKLIKEDELEALADGDELIQARRAGQAFPGWLEGPLYFPPTYKFRCLPSMMEFPLSPPHLPQTYSFVLPANALVPLAL